MFLGSAVYAHSVYSECLSMDRHARRNAAETKSKTPTKAPVATKKTSARLGFEKCAHGFRDTVRHLTIGISDVKMSPLWLPGCSNLQQTVAHGLGFLELLALWIFEDVLAELFQRLIVGLQLQVHIRQHQANGADLGTEFQRAIQ